MGDLCRELKVVTGEWFIEERSKRFEREAPSSDVIKQTILNTPSGESDPRSPDHNDFCGTSVLLAGTCSSH